MSSTDRENKKFWVHFSASRRNNFSGMPVTVAAQLRVYFVSVGASQGVSRLLEGLSVTKFVGAGYNGVDNGFLRFDHVLVPHSAMLSRFAQVSTTPRLPAPRQFVLQENLTWLQGSRTYIDSS